MTKKPEKTKLREKIREKVHLANYRNRWRAMNMMERTLLGPLAPQVNTPRDLIFMWERSTLYHYELPRVPKRYRIPLLIIPPLMVKPTIFDLRPGHSMVAYYCSRGFDVYMIDFGIPTSEDRHIQVDDYVSDFIPNAVAKVMERSGSKKVSLLGWSMGGIMSYAYSALTGAKGPVQNLIAVGSPYDFSKMFPFNALAQLVKVPGVRPALESLGNIPPWMTMAGFKLLDPVKMVSRYGDLYMNYWDREWVAAWETMSGWAGDFIPYPGNAFMQFVLDFILGDKLRKGELVIGGTAIDMGKLAASLLMIIGTADKVAPYESVAAADKWLVLKDKTKLEVPLGHIGLISGSRAPELVWAASADWLAERSIDMTAGKAAG